MIFNPLVLFSVACALAFARSANAAGWGRRVSAFAVPHVVVPPEDSAPAQLIEEDVEKLNFHKVLERVGKTVLRPGGSAASRRLHRWGQLDSRKIALEVAGGLGVGAISLAKESGCHVIMTDRDGERIVKAQENANAAGVGELVSCKEADMFAVRASMDAWTDMESDSDSVSGAGASSLRFDAVLAEAVLTHYPGVKKLEFLTQVKRDLLQTDGVVLLHEVCFFPPADSQAAEKLVVQVRQDMGRHLRVPFFPESLDSWSDILQQAGLQVVKTEHGPMKMLNPRAIVEDEGVSGIARIAWNIATDGPLRRRIASTKATLDGFEDNLGYVIIAASAASPST